MVEVKHFYYDSKDKQTKIHAMCWRPNGEVYGILQIAHGMVEFIERYDEFAKYLAERGILVTGNDHLGHGESIREERYFGYFSEQNGNANVIKDIHQLRGITEKRYPHIPYFILGHSMGSFLLRQYLCYYGGELDGAIIMGTGSTPRGLIKAGSFLTTVMARFKGWEYRSKLVDSMSFGGYNKKIKNNRTERDWLTKDEKIVDAYIADKRCQFIFSLNAYHNMFIGMLSATDSKNIAKIPKDIPILFVAGQEDPVGDFGKGVQAVAKSYEKAGIKSVTCKLYEQDRHEILNEKDRENVFKDLYEWLNIKISENSGI